MLRLAEHAALRNWGSCVAPSSSLGLREHGEVPRPLSAGETQQIRRPGYIRTPVTFSCSAKRKVTKEKAAPVSRAERVPCAACLTSAAVELARCAKGRPRAQTVLAETPRSSELLGAPQGPQLREAVVPVGRNNAAHCAPTIF